MSLLINVENNETFETTDFKVDRILGDDQNTILDSRIVEASVIHYVLDSGNLIIPSDVETYYYLEDEEIIWEKTDSNDGELRRFLTGIKVLIGEGQFEGFVFDMDNMLEIDFDTILESRTLEATLANMVNGIINGGVLDGFIKDPEKGYHWYYHENSEHDDEEVREIRSGQFMINGNPQYSDLSGFLKAIQAMNNADLNFKSITKESISTAIGLDPNVLADALCDYSRIIGGSIATMLNKVLEGIPFAPSFNDEDLNYQDKQDIVNGLITFKTFVDLLA
jgi:hypothetical protein